MKLSRLASVVVAGGLAFLAVSPYQGIAAAQSTPKATAKTVDLRPKFKVGQETRFKMEQSSTGNAGAGGVGDGQPVNMTVEATVLLRCTDANAETGYMLDVTFDAYKCKLKAGGMSIDFDSSKPAKPDDPMDEVMRSVMGTKLKVKMDLDGNISSIDGGGGGMGGELMSGADVMKGMVGPIFTSKKGNGQYSVGEKWTNEDTMEAGMGTVRMTTTNTLKSHANSIATVDMNGKFSLDPSSGKGVTIRDSQMTGEFHWNTEVGMLDSMTTKQRLTVEQKQDKGPPSRTTQDMNLKVQRLPGGNKGVAPAAPKATTPAKPKEWDPDRKK